MNKEEVKDLITDMWKDELSKSGKWALEEYIKDLQSQLDIANKKLDKIKELVNKYGYYTLSEIPEILSIIGGNDGK